MPNPVIEALKALQYVDKQIWALERRRGDRPKALTGKRRELAAREQSQAGHLEEKKAVEKDTDRANLDLQSAEDALQKLEVARNTAKTNKEYQTLTNQIGDKKSEISKYEDAVLSAMNRGDEIGTLTAEFESEVARVTTELADLEREVQTEIADLDERIGELRGQREEKTAPIDAEARQRYERILEKRNGNAMAPVIRGACQGCGGTLTPQEQNTLLKDSGLVYCRHCARILYQEEG